MRSCRVCQKIFCNKCSSDRIAGKRACIECMTIFKVPSASPTSACRSPRVVFPRLDLPRPKLLRRRTSPKETRKVRLPRNSPFAHPVVRSDSEHGPSTRCASACYCARVRSCPDFCGSMWSSLHPPVRQLSPGMQSKVSAIKTAEALRKWWVACSCLCLCAVR